MRLRRGQPETLSVGAEVFFELDEHTIGIWFQHSGELNKDDELPEVDGNNENVDDEVLFCLKSNILK